jgi:hypothetical protein
MASALSEKCEGRVERSLVGEQGAEVVPGFGVGPIELSGALEARARFLPIPKPHQRDAEIVPDAAVPLSSSNDRR